MARAAGGGDVSQAMKAALADAKKKQRAVGIRRTKSHNPAKVPVREELRVQRHHSMPTAEELLHSTYEKPVLGESDRAIGMPAPGQGLPTAEELLAMGGSPLLGESDGQGVDDKVDRTEYLSPVPSSDPGRPRAREARYNPDARMLTVVFRDGGTYAYYGVPGSVWRALKRNKSFGRTMDRLVLNVYPYEKIAF